MNITPPPKGQEIVIYTPSTSGKKTKQQKKIKQNRQQQLNAKALSQFKLVEKNLKSKNKILGIKNKSSKGKNAKCSPLECLLMTLVLPGADTTSRWSSPFSSKKTAVAEPFAVIPASWGQTLELPPSGYVGQMIVQEVASFLFRNPLRSAIIYDQNSSYQTSLYLANFDNSGSPSVTSDTLTINGNGPIEYYPEISSMFTYSSYSPHGPILFGGSVKNRQGTYFWADAGQTVRLTVNNVTPGSLFPSLSIVFFLDSYDNEGVHPNVLNILSNTSLAITTLTLSITSSGYYCPHVTVTNGSYPNPNMAKVNFNYSVTDTGTSHFCHLSIPGLNNNLGAVKGIRMLGLSLMYTNTSAAIQLGGTISGFQAGTDDNWQNYVSTASSGSLSLFASVQDSTTLNAARGMYSFLKPTDPRDFDFKDDLVTNVQGQPINTNFELDANDSFVAFVMNNPNSEGTSGYHTIRYAVEYLTNDPWRSTGVSYVDESLASQAIAKIRDFQQFHENPLHWSDLWSGIQKAVKTVANAVVDYGPMAMKLAGMLI
jgi:hypothetical protein